jgi:hypothetical protein
MPALNGKALDTALSIALDIMDTKVGEEIEINFKDEPMKFKRIR